MEALFLRLLSLILSVLMFFNNAFSFIFPQEPVENAVGIHGSELFETEDKDGSVSVVSDYVSWYKIADRNSVSLKKYDWKFFFKHNIVLVTVELPNPGYTVKVESVAENGETLELSYSLIEGEGDYTTEIVYEVILVETSKNIKMVSASGSIIENMPVIIPSDNFCFVADIDDVPFDILSSTVISDYDLLSAMINPVPDELKKYDKDYFKTENIAVIPVVLPGSAYEITVDSVTENESELAVEYTISSNGNVNTASEIMQYIIVETSKNITNVSAKETVVKPEEIYEMQEFTGYNYFVCDSDNFVSTYPNRVINSIDSLKSALSYSATGFAKYDEKYFAEKSLAVVYVYFPSDGKVFRPNSIEKNEIKKYNSKDELIGTEQRLNVSGWIENGNSSALKGYVAVVIETNEKIDSVYFERIGLSDEGAVFDYECFNGLKLLDGQSEIIYDYETLESIADLSYFERYGICEEFFEEKALALAAVFVPNEDYGVEINSLNQKNALFEIVCTVSDDSGSSSTLVSCKIIVAEVSKETGLVNLTVNNDKISFDRYSIYRFNLTTNDAPVLVSDYETWSGLLKKTSTSLEKYNEAYFKNNSVVIIPEKFTNGAIEPEFIKLYENGGTLEVVYGLNKFHDAGFSDITEEVILIEVSSEIKNISVMRKDLKNKYKTLNSYDLMMNEPTVISDYEKWSSMVDVTNEKYSMYDEEYFKNKSIALFKATLPDSGAETIVKYAYEDGNTLEAGYTSYSTGGLTMISYQAVLVEVSKNVTEINVTKLK